MKAGLARASGAGIFRIIRTNPVIPRALSLRGCSNLPTLPGPTAGAIVASPILFPVAFAFRNGQ